MTPKQKERILDKIKKIKAALAADKKQWGGEYHDGRGLRYLPPKLYIEIEDFTGGLRYVNWFHKNFLDDSCYPNFFFEWTIILFKTKRLKEAERKAFETFCDCTYYFDSFFGREVLERNLCSYSNKQENLADFSEWLAQFIQSEKFLLFSCKLIDIQKRIMTGEKFEIRSSLFDQQIELIKEF